MVGGGRRKRGSISRHGVRVEERSDGYSVEKRRRTCALTEESIGRASARAAREVAWRRGFDSARLGAERRGVAVGVAGRQSRAGAEGRGLNERCPCHERRVMLERRG